MDHYLLIHQVMNETSTGTIIGVVIVILLIIGGIWWYMSQSNTAAPATTTGTPATGLQINPAAGGSASTSVNTSATGGVQNY